jgi:hypothetical protein
MFQQQLPAAACMKISRASVHSLRGFAADLAVLVAVLVLFVLNAATTAPVLWSPVAPAVTKRQPHQKARRRFGIL